MYSFLAANRQSKIPSNIGNTHSCSRFSMPSKLEASLLREINFVLCKVWNLSFSKFYRESTPLRFTTVVYNKFLTKYNLKITSYSKRL